MSERRLKPGWSRVTFGDVVKLNTDRVPDPLAAGIERYVGLEHITPEDLRIRNWGLVAEGTTFTNYFKPGQVLFGKRRAYQRKVAMADFAGVCSSDIYVFEPRDERLLPELLPFICQTESFYQHAVGTSAGSLSPRTNWEQLAKYEFALPPVEEQRRIADILVSMDNLQQTQSSLFSKCQNLQTVIFYIGSQSSNGCTQVALTDLCNIQTGKLDSNAAVENGDYPFFTCDPEERRINSYAFDCDSIILAGNNAQGNFWVKNYDGKFNAYQRTYVLTIKNPEIARTDFITIVLRSLLHELKSRSIGSTTKYVTLTILSKLIILLPPLDLQNQIMTQYNNLETQLTTIKNRQSNLRRLRVEILKFI